jgi:ribosomal protein L11 methyltransferase
MEVEINRTWTELDVRVPEAAADTVSDYLFGITGRGVCIKEDGAEICISAFLAPDSSEDIILKIRGYLDALAEMDLIKGGFSLGFKDVAEEDWLSVFRSQHTTVRISDRLTVRPSWCEAGPGHEVVLDPGMAFGTGSHATTRMCLELLDNAIFDPPPGRMFDLGTGSGILAIAAAFLGVRDILAVDIDPESIATAAENARLNGLEGAITFAEGSAEQASGSYDILAANLSMSLLKKMAPELAAMLNPGGCLIASGILESERGELEKAFTDAGLTLSEARVDDIWLAVAFVKQETG